MLIKFIIKFTNFDGNYENMIKISKYNRPRVGKKRWSIKYKRKINCKNPKGFSQRQYCKRKSKSGKYKSSLEIISDLIKLANNLDFNYLSNEADRVDKLLARLVK